MVKACNLQKGNVVDINGQPYQVRHIDVQTPSARGANTLYKVRFAAVSSGQKLDQTFKGNDTLEALELERRPVSFLYNDQGVYTFMDTENFEQYPIPEDALGEDVQWLTNELAGIVVLLLDGVPLCIELPPTAVLEIVDTAPSIKGASATNRNKPATLSNGVTVLVPEYLSPGELIQVNTETGKFMSRARE